MRWFVSLFLLTCVPFCLACRSADGQSTERRDRVLREIDQDPRPPQGDQELRDWLENMIWHHDFSITEIRQATSMSAVEITSALRRLDISRDTRPAQSADAPLLVLPYPGGRHPRIGFLDGAIRPQRETKISVFTPWDRDSYVVVDVPEAIWSNLGLTYLAHTHVPTYWSKQNLELPQLEWRWNDDGSLQFSRALPNGIVFGTHVVPHVDHVQLEMWLTNNTPSELTDLRVQNCVMLKGAAGFEQQTNDNKVMEGSYAVCRSADGRRWIITAWTSIHRTWANPPCPCLHADPRFPDCAPGQTRRLRGWLSFYEGNDIHAELARIEQTGWRQRPFSGKVEELAFITGRITDAESGRPIPARLHVQDAGGKWYLAESADPSGSAVHYNKSRPNMPDSVEVHTTLSAHPFQLQLAPGQYRLRIERGKEYLPLERTLRVESQAIDLDLPLRRWINMSDRGWYSGDTHVHRSLEELPNIMLAEDLNVALPLTYWVRQSGIAPAMAGNQNPPADAALIVVDDDHVIHPINTEYEIFSVAGRQHTLGAVFVLNHQEPLTLATPPVRPVAMEARRQGALLDLDKHSWPWSLMIVPIMEVDLFELANNHLWQTNFGFKQWTLPTMPEYMHLETDDVGFTEWGWTDFGFQSYYALLNCGFPLRVSAGTASGVHPVQLGFGRVYVHLQNGFSYSDWIQGLDAGRSFVSTGPMLEVTFSGEDPGHRFKPRQDVDRFSVEIGIVARSRRKLGRIEIVAGGQVTQTISPPNVPMDAGGFESNVKASIDVGDSTWIAVRCFEVHPDRRVRFAHTNPVFVDIQDRPLRPRQEEVGYLMERMREEITRNQDVLDADSLHEYRRALALFERIAENAR